MYPLLILFFGSLLGIIFMIGRKLILIQNGEVLISKEAVFEVPFVKDIKHTTTQSLKYFAHITLVETIRAYVKTTNFLENAYENLKTKIKGRVQSNDENISEEKREMSKFLKIISEYKQKIRKIKHRIREEEKNS